LCGSTAKVVRNPVDTMEGSVHEHKFKVGQSVSFTSGPPEGDDHQYRIKNGNEPHERVIKESRLDRIA
jgi:hypothetical protein